MKALVELGGRADMTGTPAKPGLSVGRSVFAMSTANAVVLVVSLGSYLLYSRLLGAGEFGIYAGALAVAKIGTLVLDAGLKTALVQQDTVPSPGLLRGVRACCFLFAVACLIALSCALWLAQWKGWLSESVAVFYAMFAAAYFATYPWLVTPLARLEREMRFGTIARTESVSASIEYGLPALLWWWVAPGFWSFVVGAWLARVLRAAMLARSVAAPVPDGGPVRADWRATRALLGSGAAFQAAVLASMVRDSLHLILVGPWFGREAAGLYAWALQLCAAGSQVFVQTASRVALPWFKHHTDAASQLQATRDQIAWLTILTFPAVALLPVLAPSLDHALFHDKWTAAIALLPYLVARMLPGLATTPLGTLLLARHGALAYARVNWMWTAIEAAAAVILLITAGPVGLALSYSVIAWIGVALLASGLGAGFSFRDVARLLLQRPSVWLAAAFALLHAWLPTSVRVNAGIALMYCSAAFVICVLSEPSVRSFLQRLSAMRSWRR